MGIQALRAAVNFSFQGQRWRSNILTFILVEPTKIHYHVKLHQNMTISFKVLGIFIQEIRKLSRSNLPKSIPLRGLPYVRNTYSHQVTSI